MRLNNPLILKNYQTIVGTSIHQKFKNKYNSKNYNQKKYTLTIEKELKLKNNSNLILIIFTCLSLNTRSNAVNINDAIRKPLASVVVDGNLLNIKREDIFNERFLFSNRTTQNTEIESEIQEIEDDEFRYSAWKNSQVGLTVGGSAVSMWFAYKGLNVWEKWMKEQEQKDIDEEIEMTGTYINPGAGNVESSIDPITGKKIEIKSQNDINGGSTQ